MPAGSSMPKCSRAGAVTTTSVTFVRRRSGERSPSPHARMVRRSCPPTPAGGQARPQRGRLPATAGARRGSTPRRPRGERDIARAAAASRCRTPPRERAPRSVVDSGVISVTTTSRQAFTSSITEPSITLAGRIGGCGYPSAAWTNRSTSSVRCTTASPRKRRFLRVRVPSNGQKTSSSSPHRTPIAAQLTTPSLPVVVTTVSISGVRSPLFVDKAEELLARARVDSQQASHRRRDGLRAPGLRAPRIVMHMCSARSTTPTPRGESSCSSQSAICTVMRSWSCRSRENASTTRASFEMPMMHSSGR